MHIEMHSTNPEWSSVLNRNHPILSYLPLPTSGTKPCTRDRFTMKATTMVPCPHSEFHFYLHFCTVYPPPAPPMWGTQCLKIWSIYLHLWRPRCGSIPRLQLSFERTSLSSLFENPSYHIIQLTIFSLLLRNLISNEWQWKWSCLKRWHICSVFIIATNQSVILAYDWCEFLMFTRKLPIYSFSILCWFSQIGGVI